jgi:hypothetical protein
LYVRDQAKLKWPSFWLNVYRIAVHVGFVSFWVLLLTLAVMHLTGWRDPVVLFLWRVGAGVTALLWPAVFLAPLVFQFLAKCPCCGSNFVSRWGIYTPGPRCENCGYDLRSRTRAGDF